MSRTQKEAKMYQTKFQERVTARLAHDERNAFAVTYKLIEDMGWVPDQGIIYDYDLDGTEYVDDYWSGFSKTIAAGTPWETTIECETVMGDTADETFARVEWYEDGVVAIIERRWAIKKTLWEAGLLQPGPDATLWPTTEYLLTTEVRIAELAGI